MKNKEVKIKRSGLSIGVILLGAIIAYLIFFAFDRGLDLVFGIPSEYTPSSVGSDTKSYQEVLSSADVPSSKSYSKPIESTEKKLPIKNWEIELMAKAVIHETGNNEQYFAGFDINEIQKYMASVIWNRVNNPNFPNTVYDVLTQPGQFMSMEEIKSTEIDDRTYQNVIEVVLGNFQSEALYEMNFTSLSPEYNQEIMESQVGPVYPIYSAITADNRYILFAGSY